MRNNRIAGILRRITTIAGLLLFMLAGGALGAPAADQAGTIKDVPFPAKPAKHYTFTLITKSNASPYWVAVRNGAEAAAKKLGVTVTFEAPATALDLATQIEMVNRAVTSGVDGIILAAQSPQGLLEPVRGAQAHHIPVVTVDSGLSPDVSDCFLATNNVDAARDLAKYAAEHLMGKAGEYAILDFNNTASTGIERPAGFEEGMKAYPNVKRVGPILYTQNSISQGIALATNLMAQYPNLKVIFGANDRSALGPAEAIFRAHSNVKVVGFDADLGEIGYIRAGIIQASVLQSPHDMGYYAVAALINIIQGVKVPKRVVTPYFLLTPSNLHSAEATESIRQYAQDYESAG
jgi:ribose transport system substrate-binding protein